MNHSNEMTMHLMIRDDVVVSPGLYICRWVNSASAAPGDVHVGRGDVHNAKRVPCAQTLRGGSSCFNQLIIIHQSHTHSHMNLHHESSTEGERAVPTNTTRPDDPSSWMRRGEAPERAGEVLVSVGSGSLGRVGWVETAGSP